MFRIKGNLIWIGNSNGFLYIYQKNNSTFHLIESIDNSEAVDEVAFSSDFSLVALAGASQ